MGILLTLRGKGVGGTVARVGTILARFGTTAKPMERCLSHYVDITAAYDARPTLPVTAAVLARHPALMRRLERRGVEWAIHGLVHNDHAMLTSEEQRESIGRAAALFREVGVSYVGFRGPYLRFNYGTEEAVQARGLQYHSSQAVDFPVLSPEAQQNEGYRLARKLYSARDANIAVVRPRNRKGVVEIPVAIPDDEIMVDRLHLDAESQAVAWLAILEITYSRGELFTVQLHPERIFDCDYALCATLEASRQRQPEVWIATLEEIAAWWLRRERVALTVNEVPGGRFRIRIEGSPDATLLVRGLPGVESDAWQGADRVTWLRDFTVAASMKPVIGVSHSSSAALLEFLREEGFPVELADERGRHAIYLHVPNERFDEQAILAEIEANPGPLVRLWRWPAGARSALAVTGDLDSVTLQDFLLRQWETRRRPLSGKGRMAEA